MNERENAHSISVTSFSNGKLYSVVEDLLKTSLHIQYLKFLEIQKHLYQNFQIILKNYFLCSSTTLHYGLNHLEWFRVVTMLIQLFVCDPLAITCNKGTFLHYLQKLGIANFYLRDISNLRFISELYSDKNIFMYLEHSNFQPHNSELLISKKKIESIQMKTYIIYET